MGVRGKIKERPGITGPLRGVRGGCKRVSRRPVLRQPEAVDVPEPRGE